MPKGIPKSGKRIFVKLRRDRKPREMFTCKQCRTVYEVIASQLHHRDPQFCSRACYRLGTINKATRSEVQCGNCQKSFYKRTDHLKLINYCSVRCYAKARSRLDAKWRNPDHVRTYMKTYCRNNRSKLNAGVVQRNKRNPSVKKRVEENRRARKHGVAATLTTIQWNEILAAFNHRCARCGSKERIEQDHIIPLSKGGNHSQENVQPLCRSCNASKGNKLFEAVFPSLRIVEV